MDWLPQLLLQPVSLYQAAAFPFALLFSYFCLMDSFSTHARYLFLLAGGGILAVASMGACAVLIILPTLCAGVLISSLSPQQVHRWTFSFQMGWQTLCHLGLHYSEYYLQEAPPARFYIALSSLMLLTQRVTSLSLDISEGKVESARGGVRSRSSLSEHLQRALPYFSYLLFFPALLGGSLCSFKRFQARVQEPSPWRPRHCLGALARTGLQVLALEGLSAALRRAVRAGPGLEDCRHLECVRAMWGSAALLKLRFYARWALDDSLLQAAGFAAEAAAEGDEDGYVADADVWTLETTHSVSLVARRWNRSTARWLRRLALGPRLLPRAFALSAWWHGLRPGHALGFACWAAMVEADRRVRAAAARLASPAARALFRAAAWAQAQLVVAFVMLAVQADSVAALRRLCGSGGSVFPALYCVLLLLLAKRERKVQ
ncbi:ghrelin O-acyltransferase isoform X2 [Dasypus novemcinctus]|uniref:ghrelin O-acyltransferase isoform X2 n=1 Tax=Dasypus novemcinctus TaxID=9361 RepID=UPI000328E7CC|nr:ghrelin O-acyltransferase isoform X1 [Dasypus novemcinctus]